ncbi:MAG: NAD(P)H-dependent glycerol-3-phosphate dehydrogenase [Culicoidibacterales bacterium]
MMKKVIAVLGAGSWGSALAQTLTDNGHEAMLWCHRQVEADEINLHHTVRDYLPNVVLDERIQAYTDLTYVLERAEIILCVVPSQAVRPVMEQVAAVLQTPKLFITATKGIEKDTHKRMSEIITEVVGERVSAVVALTGPSHAEEVAIRQFTALVAASTDEQASLLTQKLFNNDSYMRVYRSEDIIGAELGGALKNIMAIIVGILIGLGYGDNAKAALMTRGLAEMIRLARKMGADPLTFTGLTGLGDLIVTATSVHSRNFNAGLKLAHGENMEQVLQEMATVEGMKAVVSASQLAEKYQIDMPLTQMLYRVVYESADVETLVQDMLKREMKVELY